MINKTLEYEQFANKDYLAWDAPSFRNLLIKKLNDSGVYTDQIFPGSDLSVLIDIMAYNTAIASYITNGGASDVLFTDTQLYENMNRLVKILDYNSRGFITSSVGCNFVLDQAEISSTGINSIPRYTTYSVGKTDANGNDVKYSLVDGSDGTTGNKSYSFLLDATLAGVYFVDTVDPPVFHNGYWELYSIQPIATGEDNEKITLGTIDPNDEDNPVLIAHPLIDVYVYDKSSDTYTPFQAVDDLQIYDPLDEVFSIRLNENYQYELTFGDDINGKKLTEGQVLYIVYLRSNGEDGKISAGDIDGTDTLEVSIAGLNASQIKDICFGGSDSFGYNYGLFEISGDGKIISNAISIANTESSTQPSDFEDVESIRTNAPLAFRSGKRQILDNEYKQFITSNYGNAIHDVYVMNNFVYMAEFQHYLNTYSKLTISIRNLGYKYADSADFNNVYLWLRSNSGNPISALTKQSITSSIKKTKCNTAEVVPLNALTVFFSPQASGTYVYNKFDPDEENKIVITKDENTIISDDRIKTTVVNAITNFFKQVNNEIGGIVKLNDLFTEIMSIDGVAKIQTVWKPSTVDSSTWVYKDGLVFAWWTPAILLGADLTTVTNSAVKMKNFQFPQLNNSTNLNNIVEVTGYNHFITTPEY